MNTVRLLLSLTIIFSWNIQEFDDKNVLLLDDLVEEVYMTFPLGYEVIIHLILFAIIFISQRKYITDLLVETRKPTCKPANTPIDPNQKLCMADEEISIDREIILNQFTYQPKESHLHAAYRVLHYLKGTPGKGFIFRRSEKVEVEMFTDADYGSSQTCLMEADPSIEHHKDLSHIQLLHQRLGHPSFATMKSFHLCFKRCL
ncbi:unnamed protein product [Spirodela intermedia]|uniref:Uncharacterized protein n=1 Tax=Spirodela intermedia TaxID=51605 RepID=A0A7I8KLR2_SPIIN|nr:unnamed protein product [Spirodela intermedia]